MKYYILVLGCQMNHSDSERIKSIFNSLGFQESDTEEEAEVLGVVACSVRQKAIDKVFTRIHLWNKQKKSRSLLTFLTGCILPDDRKKFLKLFDLVFDTKDTAALPDMIKQYGIVTPASLKNSFRGINEAVEEQDDFWRVSPEYSSSYEAFIPIQNGCNKFCTYCAVPYTRGREESRPSGEILEEFEELIARGYRSLTLLGQNVNSYGLDKKGQELSFPRLLDALGKRADSMEEKPWIYYTSPHPRDMTDEVLDVMAAHPSIAKQIHLPLQSGDDSVLKAMNRNHSLQDYRRIIESIRSKMPEATIFTDIIVGFPGEEEEQFMNTLRAMEEFRYNMAFIAMYSPRPGARSHQWDDTVSHEDKKDRFRRLSKILEKTSREWNRTMTGKTLDLLVTGTSRKGDKLSAKTEGLINVHLPLVEGVGPGQKIQAEITGEWGLSLEGVKK